MTNAKTIMTKIPPKPDSIQYDHSLFYFEFPDPENNCFYWACSWSEAVNDGPGSCDTTRITLMTGEEVFG